ncbi:hypothetical protein OESDEN_22498 [Oesophagostomum dentatum]|uniref:Uncharacterized protein n=1 Tax=Oesophagostomum dentatum TaxID=61180 RepID=A0A0B1RXT6_OESDE|nr:hypothetical protein OESDEN_22498 [Oesophagostomum dentatum]
MPEPRPFMSCMRSDEMKEKGCDDEDEEELFLPMLYCRIFTKDYFFFISRKQRRRKIMMKHIRIGQETLIMVGEMKETIMDM